MPVFTTEITSESIPSDNPIHQRLLRAYDLALPYVKGQLLEVGCGEGRGVTLLAPKCDHYYAVDKIKKVVKALSGQYPDLTFIHSQVPPLKNIKSDFFDVVVSFQVIEHIKQHKLFLKEISRVLKTGGVALITTPNRKKSLSRNPWHIREYTASELRELASPYFEKTEIMGITGNDKVWEYYEQNKRSVNKMMRWDIFDLQHKLPAVFLKIPYEILNRKNRNKLKTDEDSLVASISREDYLLTHEADSSLDLFGIFTKS